MAAPTPVGSAATGYSGTFDGIHGDGLTLLVEGPTLARGVARMLNRRQNRKLRELLVTLLGAVAGSTAADSYVRLNPGKLNEGGSVPTETINIVNRVTTAADVTTITNQLATFSLDSNAYPKDGAVDSGTNRRQTHPVV